MNIRVLIILILGVSFMVAFTPVAQPKNNQEKGQQKKEQGRSANKSQGKDKEHQNNPGKTRAAQPDRGNQDQGNKGKGNSGDRGAGNNGNEGNGLGKRDRDINMDRSVNKNRVYAWTSETFKDRNKLRNAEKVSICHKFNNGSEPAVTLRVSANALDAHMNHGDVRGECPAVNDDRYSNRYWNQRNEYYNVLQNSNEQILYSQSILDYAVSRLSNARLQLASLQNGTYDPEELNRKQLAVVELEQNVSVLEQLLGVATNLVVSRLMR